MRVVVETRTLTNTTTKTCMYMDMPVRSTRRNVTTSSAARTPKMVGSCHERRMLSGFFAIEL